MQKLGDTIREGISQGLPGKKAQIKLAPEYRHLYPVSANPTQAAILILIFPNNQKRPTIVFMKRPDYSGHHSGQISFPGGKVEKIDNNIINTALRETEEEIGVDKNDVRVLGKLTSLYIPVSNFQVQPIVGIIDYTPSFTIDPAEVRYCLECPLENLRSIQILYTKKIFNDKKHLVPYFDINGEMVWGATSMILNEFIVLLRKFNI